MTWMDLKAQIDEMTEEQRYTDVTVYDPADMEFYPVIGQIKLNENSDVLDEGHPFIVVSS